MNLSKNIKVTLAGLFLLASIQYFIAEIIAAVSWKKVPYSFFDNFISDLGVPECVVLASRSVCSPAHDVMNAGFIIQGILVLTAAILLIPLIKSKIRYMIGALAGLFSIGIIIVGLFPGSTADVIDGDTARQIMHILGAGLAIIFGNLLLITTGISLWNSFRRYGILTITLGSIGLLAITIAPLSTLGLGVGGIERVAVNVIPAWYIITGGTLIISSSIRRSPGKYLFS
jgi:hypothetical membrane protein